MKAKDTVMSEDELIMYSYDGWEDFQRVAKAQAEITYPIGFEEGKKAGIKEVVEWINKNTTDIHSNGVMLTLYTKEWLVKLKEWGIERR